MAEIAEAEKGVFVGCEFGKQPGCLSVGGEKLHNGLVIGFRPLGNISVAAKMSFEFAGKQHCLASCLSRDCDRSGSPKHRGKGD